MKFVILLLLGCIMTQLCVAQNAGLREYQPKSTNVTDYYKQQITGQVLKQLDKIDWNHVDRTTTGDSILYTIPVVVHVLHNYGSELVADNSIYNMIALVNSYFLKTNPDTASIIAKFKPVAANTQITFKLATIDPNGNQTKGVEHIFTYLTYGNSNYPNQPKINQWPQEKYLNIWTVSAVTHSSTGYSYTAYDASYEPYYDGVMIDASYILYGSWLSRQVAKFLNLPYTCNYFSPPCVDGDGIADTPPCWIDYPYDCSHLYDTTCDTPNRQNIMFNYDSSCAIMFTYGQGQYMQNILQLDFGNRDSLVTPYTFSTTGMDKPMPDMLPVADFSIQNLGSTATQPYKRFFCQGQNVVFENQSWNDTVTAAAWTFSNNANISSSTSLTTVINKFHQPGWVTVALAATGNNTGTTTLTDTNALFIADSIPTNAVNYVQEFDPVNMSNWPIFNYYNNEFKWQMAHVGYFDNSSLEYTSYDTRTFPQSMVGTPEGDIDDVYTPAFDLSSFTDSCYLNFMSSGATIVTAPHSMTDSLEIDYSVNEAQAWNKLTVLKGSDLDNKGTVTIPYTPASQNDWVPHAISLPDVARTAYTIFRFRYYPGADTAGFSSGNNFYLDHFNLNTFPESVQVINALSDGVSLMPNPTQGSTYIVIKDKAAIVAAKIIVTDVTGNTMYENIIHDSSNNVRIEIPGNVFNSKGLYLVHVITDRINQTEKLVVY